MTTSLFTEHVPAGAHADRPAASVVPTGTLYACSDHHLLYQSDGAAWSTWYSPGNDRRWIPAPTETPIDEFNDDTLDPAWTRVDGNGARVAAATFTEAADVLSAYCDGGDATAEMHALMRPLSTPLAIGDAVSTCVTLVAPQGATSVASLILANGDVGGSGTQQAAQVWYDNDVQLNHAIFNFTGYNAANSPTGILINAATLFLRLVKISATQIRLDYSPDGISWVKSSAATLTMTPSHVGLGVASWGSSKKFAASFEFLRRDSGVS